MVLIFKYSEILTTATYTHTKTERKTTGIILPFYFFVNQHSDWLSEMNHNENERIKQNNKNSQKMFA